MKFLLPSLNIALVILFSSLCLPSRACLNDRDTLAEEVRGLPDVVQVITGRFERNPPLYYEMRLARVTGELKANPALLNDYDDAGVACDRLGRDDEALAWMKKKQAQLARVNQSSPEGEEAWYRFYANDGTFRVDRWIRAGADRKRIEEVEQARDEVDDAIDIKPDAHFGREKYRLQVMDWIIAGRPYKTYTAEVTTYNSPEPRTTYSQEVDRQVLLSGRIGGHKETLKGLSGLIALGNAWESVDIFYALAQELAYPPERHVSYLARLRCAELMDQGHGSLVPGAPIGYALKEALRVDRSQSIRLDPVADRQDYEQLRAEAEQWQAQRTAYMMARLQQGRHPDTDPTFWRDYHDHGALRLAIPLERRLFLALGRPFGTEINFYGILFLLGTGIGLLCLRDLTRRRQQHRQAHPREPQRRGPDDSLATITDDISPQG